MGETEVSGEKIAFGVILTCFLLVIGAVMVFGAEERQNPWLDRVFGLGLWAVALWTIWVMLK